MIVRSPREDRYTIINRSLVSDERLTFRALGLLTFILDKPNDWRIDAKELSAGEGREGRDAIRSALNELEAAGYLRRNKIRKPDGTFAMESIVYDTPLDEPHQDGSPGPGFPAPVTQAPLRETVNEDCNDDAASLFGAAHQPVTTRAAVVETTPRQRPRNELFDAVTNVCSIDQAELTRTLRGQTAKAVAELAKVGATPDEVSRRAEVYRCMYRENTLTPAALAKHWAMCRVMPSARQPDRVGDWMERRLTSLSLVSGELG